MEWKFLVAMFLFSTAVYAVRAIFGKEEEQRQQQQRRPQGQRPRPVGTDMERFLEEINRRRREAESGTRPAPTPPKRPAVTAPVSARPKPRPTTPVARRQPAAVDVVVVEEKVVKPKRLSEQPTPPAPEMATTPTPAAPATRIPTKQSAMLTEIRALLRSSRTARAGILLQEVLGPPLCHRGRPSHFGRTGPGEPHGPIA